MVNSDSVAPTSRYTSAVDTKINVAASRFATLFVNRMAVDRQKRQRLRSAYYTAADIGLKACMNGGFLEGSPVYGEYVEFVGKEDVVVTGILSTILEASVGANMLSIEYRFQKSTVPFVLQFLMHLLTRIRDLKPLELREGVKERQITEEEIAAAWKVLDNALWTLQAAKR